jgi:hypothetical protein
MCTKGKNNQVRQQPSKTKSYSDRVLRQFGCVVSVRGVTCKCCQCVTLGARVLYLWPQTAAYWSMVGVARTEWFSSLTNPHHISLWLQLSPHSACPVLHIHLSACRTVLANQWIFHFHFILRTHQNLTYLRCMIACFLFPSGAGLFVCWQWRLWTLHGNSAVPSILNPSLQQCEHGRFA